MTMPSEEMDTQSLSSVWTCQVCASFRVDSCYPVLVSNIHTHRCVDTLRNDGSSHSRTQDTFLTRKHRGSCSWVAIILQMGRICLPTAFITHSRGFLCWFQFCLSSLSRDWRSSPHTQHYFPEPPLFLWLPQALLVLEGHAALLPASYSLQGCIPGHSIASARSHPQASGFISSSVETLTIALAKLWCSTFSSQTQLVHICRISETVCIDSGVHMQTSWDHHSLSVVSCFFLLNFLPFSWWFAGTI